MSKLESYAALAVRIISLVWASLALCWLLSNILLSWSSFNPTYWYYYVEMQLLRPLIALLAAILLRFFSLRCGRCLAKGL